MVGCRQIRQRIAAKNRRFVPVEMQAQNNKLTRLEERKRLPIDWRKKKGSHAVAFLADLRNSHLSKSGPRRSLLLIRESRIPCDSFGARILLEHRLERTLPTLAKRGNLSARCSCSRECPGKYKRASISATVIRSGSSAVFTMSSPAPTSPSCNTRK